MKMNKKILASVIVIGILAFAMGLGTYSQFSDTNSSQYNTLTSGTLNIELSNDQTYWYGNVSNTWTTPGYWKPGDGFNSTLSVRNVGNIGCYWLHFCIEDLTGDTGTGSFADNIFVEEFCWWMFKPDGSLRWMVNWTAAGIAGWGPFDSTVDTDIMTLQEFFNAYPYGPMAWEDVPPGILGPNDGSVVKITMLLRFNPNAGNALQGKSCTFEARVWAAQSGYPVVYYPIWENGGSESYGYGET